MDGNVKENAYDDTKAISPVFSNAFRIAYSETEFIVDYGFMGPEEKGKDDNYVNVVSKIIVPPDRFSKLILSLFRAAVEYEKQFNKDIGFGSNKDKDQDGE